MAEVENWPYVPSENITIGKFNSNVAVAALWTKRGDYTSTLDPESYAVVGQLYERHGINIAARNLLANPNIRHLVVCGADLSGSGEALVRLWSDGVDGEGNIKGIERATIEGIPYEAINSLRGNIQIHGPGH